MEAAITATRSVPASGVGDRLRSLRLAAGLTQTELAGERFSKEYVSQIERGKTRPTRETIEWLATRLGVDPDFLAVGVAAETRDRVETALARAESLTLQNRAEEALQVFDDIAADVRATGAPELEARTLTGRARALVRTGDVRQALTLLQQARAIVEGPGFSDVERADVLLRMGICRYLLASIATAIGLLDEALALAERTGMPCDVLRAEILQWRSACRRRQRDFEAAREDVERAIELAQSGADKRTLANTYFQASIVAERTGHWILSRTYAQQARSLFGELEDDRNVGRMTLNLGGLQLLLGKPSEAVEHLKLAFALAVEAGSQPDAAQAVGSLATVYLRLEDYGEAEANARKALELLEGREDFLDEIGQSRLTLGYALMEQGLLDEAEESFRVADAVFEQYASAGHRAGAWVAMGDLAARRGDDREAARHYRNAAEALREIRF
jgi:tetratricopeptide (TPR) repeat protein/DNA-binding XRE family transcriptional regulator